MAAAASLPTFSKDTRHDQDRFTELPENVFHTIISLLPTRDFFALYLSSKKCRELCLTTPMLTFDSLPYLNGEEGAGYADRLANYLDRFLVHRGERKTQCFLLRWYDCYRPFTFLHYAIRNGIEELYLDFTVDNAKRCFNLPHSLYSCGSLKSLTMNLNSKLFHWDFPSAVPFTNLQVLSLKFMRLNDGCLFGGWISSWCNIKEIRLEEVHVIGSINIKSSSLERFEVVYSHLSNLSISGKRLEDVNVQWAEQLCNLSISGENVKSITIQWPFDNCKDKTLKISAPNLKHLLWSGYLPCGIVLEKLMHPELVTILCLENSKGDKSGISSNLFGGLSTARELNLCGNIAKVLYEHDSPILISDTRHLSINAHHLEELFPPTLVHLLKGMHNLTSLCIYASESLSSKLKDLLPLQGHGFDMSYWERQDLKFVRQLESVELDIINGGNELELVKYLLKHAKQMKEMIIYLPAYLSCSANKRVNEFRKTPNAKVVFEEL